MQNISWFKCEFNLTLVNLLVKWTGG